ncbi:MAG: GxxExxY protein [Verrucomicrobiota bacterium]
MNLMEQTEAAIRQFTREELCHFREVIRQCSEDAESGRPEHPDEPGASHSNSPPILSKDLRASHETSSLKAPNLEELSAIVVDCAYKLHVEAGPGLLETVYEVVLAKMLEERGLVVVRQVPVRINLMGLAFDEGFRADLIVEGSLLIELKSLENLLPVHSKQVNTYLRLLKMPLGLLINYGAGTFKEGVKRIVNQHRDTALSRLRVNREED